MYSKKFLYNSVFNSVCNRANLNVKSACSDQYMINCLCTFRSVPLLELNNLVTNVKILCKNGELFEILSKRLQWSSRLKDQSTTIIRAWTRQCEYIVAQRFRRTQQMFCLYSRIWEERALRDLLKRMQQQVARRSKDLVFGAIGISTFNWETNKITDDEISKHISEFDYIHRLTDQTILCKQCHEKRLVDIMLPDKTYCKCSTNSHVYVLDNWAPFLERKDLLVWRRQRPNSNNYEYKLYGVYDDVTAEDFLKVQVDTDHRQSWDTTAISLFVVDSDQLSNSDVIYWEMLWPRMFSNRDYVFNRRYKVDEEHKVITIISKSIVHPSCPNKPDKHRVKDYESCMVIKPSTEMNRPGIEFCLTYYDDPGVNIPAAVASWVAIAGMPDFLNKLRNAAKEYRQIRENNLPLDTSMKNEDAEKENEFENPPNTMPAADEDPALQLATTSEPDKGGYWRYIHPYHYLG